MRLQPAAGEGGGEEGGVKDGFTEASHVVCGGVDGTAGVEGAEVRGVLGGCVVEGDDGVDGGRGGGEGVVSGGEGEGEEDCAVHELWEAGVGHVFEGVGQDLIQIGVHGCVMRWDYRMLGEEIGEECLSWLSVHIPSSHSHESNLTFSIAG